MSSDKVLEEVEKLKFLLIAFILDELQLTNDEIQKLVGVYKFYDFEEYRKSEISLSKLTTIFTRNLWTTYSTSYHLALQ